MGTALAHNEKPELFEPDGNGGWLWHDDVYSRDEQRDWAMIEAELCRREPRRFMTRWCYAINTHFEQDGGLPIPELIPDDWQHVDQLIKAFFPARDVLVEKSRDMMASWIAMASVLHDMLFQKNWAVMTLSRLEKLVDNGGGHSTPASLHGKVRFMYEALPPFLKASPLEFTHLAIRNPEAKNEVMGFAATENAGRAPKFQRAIADEFAWVPFSEQVMASMDRACPKGKALISTPNGKANAFYRIREFSSRPIFPPPKPGAKVSAGHFERFSIHWSLHPLRDEAWYRAEVQKNSMTAEATAQELDISYDRSLVGRVYPKFLYEKHVAGGSLAPMGAPLAYQPGRPMYLCCDFNADPLVWVIAQPYNEPPFYRVIGTICKRNATIEDGCNEFITRYGARQRVEWLMSRHEGWADRYGTGGICLAGNDGHVVALEIYGDATEEKKTVYSRVKAYGMISAALKDAGFIVKLKVPASNPPKRTRIETVNDALSKDLVGIDPSAEELIKDFESGIWNKAGDDMNQIKEDDDGSGLTRSHASSAFGYMLVMKHKVASSLDRAKVIARQQDVSALIRAW